MARFPAVERPGPLGWNEGLSLSKKIEDMQNRRASSTPADEKPIRDERSCSERIGFSPAAGDFESPAVLPNGPESSIELRQLPLVS
jgi:hypothetical protein